MIVYDPIKDMQRFFSVVHRHTPENAWIGYSVQGGENATGKRPWDNSFFQHNPEALTAFITKVSTFPSAQYFIRLTPLKERPAQGRGREEDSLGSSVLWVDIDAYKQQEAIHDQLQALELPPTLIVSSGNGLHAYWLLDHFVTDLDAVKQRNYGLTQTLKIDVPVDNCYDLARVFRLPGTYNHKQKPPRLAQTIFYDPDRVYALEQFPALEPGGAKTVHAVRAVDIPELPKNFLEQYRKRDNDLVWRISSERDARLAGAELTESGQVDRSKNDLHIALRLLGKYGRPREEVAAVLTHPVWFSGEKFRESGFGYVEATINAALTKIEAEKRTERSSWWLNGSFVAARMADSLVRRHHYIQVAGNLWRYEKGVFLPNADIHLTNQIATLLGDAWSRHRSGEVVDNIRATRTVEVDEVNQHVGFVNVQNGMLNLTTLELHPHDPKYRSLIQIPAAWQPDVSLGTVDRIVSSVLPEEGVDLFWEFLGSCFLMTQYLPKNFLLLLGPSDTGKSRLLLFVSHILGGKQNVSNVTLQQLANNRFAPAELYGKLANVCFDLDQEEAKNIGMLKSLTGDDYINAEQKYQQPFSFRNTARLFFAANQYPPVRNPDDAFFRRAVVVPCENVFTGANRDPDVLDKLKRPENMSAALVRAVQGYRRLQARGWELRLEGKVEHATRRYRHEVDSVAAWLMAETVEDPVGVIVKQDAYQYFRGWCQDTGRQIVSERVFFSRMKELADDFGFGESYKTGVHADRYQVWCYTGRRILTERGLRVVYPA